MCAEVSRPQIHLPHNYHFGLTGQSAEPPDSFEVRSFVVHTIKEGRKIIHDHGNSYKADWHDYDNEADQWSHDAADWLKQANKAQRQTTQQQPPKGDSQKPLLQRRNVEVDSSSEPRSMSSEDEAAFRSSSDSARINLIHKQIGLLWSDITRMRKQIDQQQNEVTQLLSRVEGHIHTISGDTDNTKHTVEMLERELDVIKNSVRDRLTLQDMRREIEGLKDMLTHNKDFKELLEVMNWKMSDHHEDFHEGMLALFVIGWWTVLMMCSIYEELATDELLCFLDCGEQHFPAHQLCGISEAEGGELKEVDVMIVNDHVALYSPPCTNTAYDALECPCSRAA